MSAKFSLLGLGLLAGLFGTACGGATRSASPQSAGTAGLTSAQVNPRFERVLVAEKGMIAMVARDGCVAALSSGGGGMAPDDTGDFEEMRVRCPKPERLKAWFAQVDRITGSVALDPVPEDSDDDTEIPAAELVTAKGSVLKVRQKADTERIIAEVRALSAELASAEVPSPGPKSDQGWQMLRVTGPAHIFLAGTATTGVLEARISTNGQYLCEFVASTKSGPIRATKSGWISPAVASTAIDDILSPFADVVDAERRPATFAAGTSAGAERRANAASTAAVFQRFAHVQDALGDACLPELDSPGAPLGL